MAAQKSIEVYPALRPVRPRQSWSLERIWLAAFNSPRAGFPYYCNVNIRFEWAVPFEFADDNIDLDDRAIPLSYSENWELAELISEMARDLCRHPNVRLRIEGFARVGAPAIFGFPLAQARATRLRLKLLKQLQTEVGARDVPPWLDDELALDAGVHVSSYDESDPDFDDIAAFYQPRVVGERIIASGGFLEDADAMRAKLEAASRETVDTFRNRDDIMSGQIAWVRVEGVD